jgi:hypothetical protein
LAGLERNERVHDLRLQLAELRAPALIERLGLTRRNRRPGGRREIAPGPDLRDGCFGIGLLVEQQRIELRQADARAVDPLDVRGVVLRNGCRRLFEERGREGVLPEGLDGRGELGSFVETDVAGLLSDELPGDQAVEQGLRVLLLALRSCFGFRVDRAECVDERMPRDGLAVDRGQGGHALDRREYRGGRPGSVRSERLRREREGGDCEGEVCHRVPFRVECRMIRVKWIIVLGARLTHAALGASARPWLSSWPT